MALTPKDAVSVGTEQVCTRGSSRNVLIKCETYWMQKRVESCSSRETVPEYQVSLFSVYNQYNNQFKGQYDVHCKRSWGINSSFLINLEW